ncbi:MAG: hypothetical protein Q9188_006886, partial [Gyalolechia gomerana]
DKFAQGKERSYVTALENRIGKLERDIARAKVQKGEDIGSQAPTSSLASTALTTRGQRKEESHLNELVSDFGFLSVNATSRDFDGLAQDVFAQLILAPSTLVRLPLVEMDVLPPRHTVTSLVQHYIGHDLALYPFLSEAKIFGSVEALYEGRASPSDEWTVFLILAISLASFSRFREDVSYAEAVRYAGSVQKHANMVLLPGSLQAIQMMLLLVQYSMRDPRHFDSWYLAGAAARMTVDLGLHQDPPKSAKMKESQLDLRRRIFYSVYSLDRATSMVHRRAFSFTDDSTNVEEPKFSSATSVNHTTQRSHPAIELIQLRKAASDPYLSLYQSGPDVLHDPWPTLCSAHLALDEWEHRLCRTDVQETQKSLLRTEMLYIKMVLLSPTRLSRPLEEYGQLLIFDHAYQYSQLMSLLVKDGINVARCTSYDLLRTTFVAQTIVGVLANYEDLCCGEVMPSTPETLASTDLPRLTAFSGCERLVLAITMLSMLDGVVQKLSGKYGWPGAWISSKPHFDRVYAMLSACNARVRGYNQDYTRPLLQSSLNQSHRFTYMRASLYTAQLENMGI